MNSEARSRREVKIFNFRAVNFPGGDAACHEKVAFSETPK